jgi:hypothetical protein
MKIDRGLIGKIQVLVGLIILFVCIPYLYWTINTMGESFSKGELIALPYLGDTELSNETFTIIEMDIRMGATNMAFSLQIIWLLTSSIMGILSIILILQGLANIKN